MSYERFGWLLRAQIGLNPASVGPAAIERAVNARLRARAIGNLDRYWDELHAYPAEMQALIEEVVVPETWFFRDPDAFRMLGDHVLRTWQPSPPADMIQMLSVPCSTGEEPYTMAMALIDAGVPAGRFAIDAVDVSEMSLARARRGIYSRNSFRGSDVAYRDRHFAKIDAGYQIHDGVRAGVRLRQANILDPGFQSAGQLYDVIFCRNLLIYFDQETQHRALSALVRLLDENGLLFVGHSEAGLVARHGLESARIPMAFAFRKQAAKVTRPAATGYVRNVTRPLPAMRMPGVTVAATPVATLAATSTAVAARPAASSAPEAGIDDLRRIADLGQLVEAEQACQAYLRRHGPAADVFLLLGLIADAADRVPDAVGYYRKALYLDPTHIEALDHLALMLDRQGDAAGAQRARDRMARLNAADTDR